MEQTLGEDAADATKALTKNGIPRGVAKKALEIADEQPQGNHLISQVRSTPSEGPWRHGGAEGAVKAPNAAPHHTLSGTEAVLLAGDEPGQGGAFAGRFFRSGCPEKAA